MSEPGNDRTVHATLHDQDAEVVRYDRAGKWYLEPREAELRRRKRRRITLNGGLGREAPGFRRGEVEPQG